MTRKDFIHKYCDHEFNPRELGFVARRVFSSLTYVGNQTDMETAIKLVSLNEPMLKKHIRYYKRHGLEKYTSKFPLKIGGVQY